MTTKTTTPKNRCPATSKDAKCGIDELAAAVLAVQPEIRAMQAELKAIQTELQKVAASIEKLWHGAHLEYYATVAKQLVGVPTTLEKVEKLLTSVLNDRAEGHQAIEMLKGEVAEIKAWQTMHERTAHAAIGSGSIRP